MTLAGGGRLRAELSAPAREPEGRASETMGSEPAGGCTGREEAAAGVRRSVGGGGLSRDMLEARDEATEVTQDCDAAGETCSPHPLSSAPRNRDGTSTMPMVKCPSDPTGEG